jgi:hypothetical protein
VNNITIVNIIRFILLIAIQVLFLRQFYYGPVGGVYFRGFIYPLFLLLLPFRTTAEIGMLIAFGTGLFVDLFYDTFGIHASASVILMAVRGIILDRIQPKGGYNLNKGLTPDSYGWNWFFRYVFFTYLVFSLWLSALEVFQLWKVGAILLRALFILPISLFFIFISIRITNPRN